MHVVEQIGRMVLQSFARVWPLLLISIPIAVVLRVSGISNRLTGAFGKRPIVGILVATAVGALGPFCSCTVIPVIAAMLVGGVPLAAVMSFWVASPTMDPEIFFLSVAFLGWPLAIGRLAATLLLSLAAGFLTHWITQRGWLQGDLLRDGVSGSATAVGIWGRVRGFLTRSRQIPTEQTSITALHEETSSCGCTNREGNTLAAETAPLQASEKRRFLSSEKVRQVRKESISMLLWVTRFMLLAFTLEALIKLYVPQDVIVQWVGESKPWAPALAALVGIPLYTGNLMAVPLIGGLLSQGMSESAALGFLIAGPITTIPAMAAVWGVVKRRVFLLYLGIGLIGAIALSYLYGAVRLILGRAGV